MWFDELAASENPGRAELVLFVDGVRRFLATVLEDRQNFAFLWEGAPGLRESALDTFRGDIAQGAGRRLDERIWTISPRKLRDHGLEGRPLRFKFQVLASVSNRFERLRGQVSIREWFRKVSEAIDAILDSLIDAAGGAGGLIKEFKDSLSALA